jgi:hypothetical protein
MANIVEYDKSFEKKKIGSGCNGVCYLTSDNQVFKRIDYPEIFEQNLRSLVGKRNPTYVFPKQLVSLNSIIIGYIMDYVEGVRLDYLGNEISIQDYLNALRIAEYDIAAISSMHIFSIDVSDDNILFSKDKRFKIIDTDYYRKLKTSSNIYNSNLRNFSHASLSLLLNLYKDRFKNNNLEYLRESLINGTARPSQFISTLLNYIQISDISNSSVAELKDELKLLYKNR